MSVTPGAGLDLRGGCHCGAITVRFESAIVAADLDVRACQCTFCRRHGGLTISDPRGRATVAARGDSLSRYRFGENTSDFLICARCGVYVGAALLEEGGAWVTLNSRCLDGSEALRAPRPVTFDAEDRATRIARRRERWTPLVLTIT